MPIIKNSKDLDYDYLERLYENKVFEIYIPKEISSRRYEEIKISNDNLTFKLIDKNQRDLVSLIHGEINTYHENEYFEIAWSYSKFPKQGYLTYLFELLVNEFNYKVLSDKYQTSPGSKEFWQSHIKKNKFEVYRLDLDTKYKRNAKSFNENQIWDVSNNIDDQFPEILRPDDFSNEIFEENVDLDYQSELIQSFEREIENNNFDEINIGIENTRNNKMENIRLVAQKNIC
jgi:hypothetical protein